MWETNRGGTSRNVIAPANFVAWRERAQTLEHLGMVGPATVAMIVDGQPAKVAGLTFSADVFARWASSPRSAAPTRPRKISAATARSSC